MHFSSVQDMKQDVLFIDGETILSQEGTTQGDPLAMGMYALGTLPLIHELNPYARQIWFADATAGGKLTQLREWWDKIVSLGPTFGYFANPLKTWLIVKSPHLQAATELFHGTGVNITVEGKRHLGAAVGRQSFVHQYVEEKVAQWVQELDDLATIARSHSQAAYATSHGFIGKWSYLIRTIPNISDLLVPLEDAISKCFLSILTGKAALSDLERALFALPINAGGLSIPKPTDTASTKFISSCKITGPIVDTIV